MKDILQLIVEDKRQELLETDFSSTKAQVADIDRKIISMLTALKGSTSGIIAEFKRRSPSKGWINQDADVSEIIRGYSRAGATCCSILTNEKYFGGSKEHLVLARKAVPHLPLLRKEFIIDPMQVYEAKLLGADAILLIAACLSKDQCSELSHLAHELNMEVLLEIHSIGEVEYLNKYVDMVGVNNRNLCSFHTDINNSFQIADHISNLSSNIILISESGIDNPQTIKELRKVGCRGFLMGEMFMKSDNPSATLLKLISEL